MNALSTIETENPFTGIFSVNRLARSVSKHMEIPLEKIMGHSRLRYHVIARSIVIYFCRERGMSYKQIGMRLGGKDHSTILHGHRNLKGWLKHYPDLKACFEMHRILESGKPLINQDWHVQTWAAQLRADRPKVINLARRAKIDPDDTDAVKRLAGSNALSKALAAAGGWR